MRNATDIRHTQAVEQQSTRDTTAQVNGLDIANTMLSASEARATAGNAQTVTATAAIYAPVDTVVIERVVASATLQCIDAGPAV